MTVAKDKWVTVSVHHDVPVCCRQALLHFAAGDRYRGGGEPGDQIACGCGNWLIYDGRGWRPKDTAA